MPEGEHFRPEVRVMKPGLGGEVELGRTIVLTYQAAFSEAELDAGDLFERSDEFPRMLAFTVGARQLNSVLETALLGASIGDSLRIRLPGDAMRDSFVREKLPDGADVWLDVNISTKSWNVTADESHTMFAPLEDPL
ncbi:hypothetical protein BZB76_3772 [Actinomadura pelletieri DSM 43383]|uniref:peptidylprolyl isomerase n=1 Tax=Actinomadura pelletieri DSM 43383 TaxID=1120940 RepID=A0A495QKP7_9ACTN|nr:hypothetical protein [Actinomadura pelletieri]RKS73088.1 hypothetical protein BZB76_3772 [Actinomadura pelletieri DSM 43383]